jgi:hypothetical protein
MKKRFQPGSSCPLDVEEEHGTIRFRRRRLLPFVQPRIKTSCLKSKDVSSADGRKTTAGGLVVESTQA